jgi:thiol:disulfide interchange protein DsbC
MLPTFRALALAAGLGLCAVGVPAQEAAIRKNLAERLPNLPKIDEVAKTPIPGLYEVRIGTEILYSDEQGNHILQGNLIDTRTRTDLTEARIAKLTAIEFASLPLKDAITIRQGSGARRLAVFVDPNCGYCKKFERDLASAKDVTIYAFLYPILGPDSTAKSKDIWCAADPAKAWRDWMIGGTVPPKTMGDKCDTKALERNLAFGQKHKVQGTPALVFEDGSRVPGAIPLEQVEKGLAQAAKRS